MMTAEDLPQKHTYSDDDLEEIRLKFNDSVPKACGYRVLIRPIDATQGMEGAEAEEFSELAKKGFQTKSKNQGLRESKGSDVGVVVGVGPDAYKRSDMPNAWCEAGDVVLFRRYEGHEFEWPPMSGNRYHLVNDEDIFGKAEFTL